MTFRTKLKWGGAALAGGLLALSAGLLLTPRASAANAQFLTTANPVALNVPISIPHTPPVVVSLASNVAFGNAPPPYHATVALPKGPWSKVLLKITGTESGRQYDRLLQVSVGSTELYLGVTPEPTPAGITWNVTKDVTGYLPLLSGRQTFSVTVDNYLNSIDTGIPHVSAELVFYPGQFSGRQGGLGALGTTSGPQSTWNQASPDSIVPLSATTTSLSHLGAGKTFTATVQDPTNVVGAVLHLYVIGQSNDEFWWASQPAFREVEISVDGHPAGVVWPFPYIYTGGVNPLLWRPITAIHTLNIPAYHVDLNPFAGLLGGTHTITITVAGNANYWLVGGYLALYQNHGQQPTAGTLVKDTLTFPTQPVTNTSQALSSSNNQLEDQTALNSYQIEGRVTSGHKTWTSNLTSNMTFYNDQTNVMPGYWQLLHGAQYVTTTDSVSGPSGTVAHTVSTDYTIDASSSFLQPSGGGNAFFLPADVTQTLDVSHQLTQNNRPAYSSTLHESVQGYGALEENGAASPITKGSTTGYLNYQNSLGQSYQELIMARGGQIYVNQVINHMSQSQ